jgi:hypothetical protein
LNLTPLAIIASIFAVVTLIKLATVIISKMVWYKRVASPVYRNPVVSSFIFSILAIILFYFLLKELSIVQIFAVIPLAGVLMGLGFLAFAKEMLPVLDKIYSAKLNVWHGLYIVFWFIVPLWVLYEIWL